MKNSLHRTWKIPSTYNGWTSVAFNRHPPRLSAIPQHSQFSLLIHLRYQLFSGQSLPLRFTPPLTFFRHATDAHSCEHRTNGVWGNWWTSGTRHPEIEWKSDKKKKKEKILIAHKRIDKEGGRHSFHHRFIVLGDYWHCWSIKWKLRVESIGYEYIGNCALYPRIFLFILAYNKLFMKYRKYRKLNTFS